MLQTLLRTVKLVFVFGYVWLPLPFSVWQPYRTFCGIACTSHISGDVCQIVLNWNLLSLGGGCFLSATFGCPPLHTSTQTIHHCAISQNTVVHHFWLYSVCSRPYYQLWLWVYQKHIDYIGEEPEVTVFSLISINCYLQNRLIDLGARWKYLIALPRFQTTISTRRLDVRLTTTSLTNEFIQFITMGVSGYFIIAAIDDIFNIINSDGPFLAQICQFSRYWGKFWPKIN